MGGHPFFPFCIREVEKMRLNKWLLSLIAVGIVVLPALAQQPRPMGFDLWTNKGFQDELKIDADTAKKASEIVTKMREKLTADRKKLTGEELEGEKGAKLNEENRAETAKALGEVLKADQVKRYQQISFQQRIRGNFGGGGGGNMTPSASFAHAEVAKALKLTKEQSEDVKKLNEDYGKAYAAAARDAGQDRAKRTEATNKVREEYTGKFQKVLTAEQVKVWDDVHGKPFTIQFQRPMQ